MRALRALTWLLVVSCGLWGGGEDDKERRKRRTVQPTVVATAMAEVGSVDEILEASGTVEALAQADLSPESTGRVIDVRVEVGDPVRRGQVLAVVRNETARGGAARAVDEVAHLQQTYDELVGLQERGAASTREVQEARYNLDQARLRLVEAESVASDTRLVAPFDGVVAVREVRVGEVASAGARAFQVVDPGTLIVRARLPEQDLNRVAAGQRATLRSAYDPQQTTQATVSRVAPVVDSTSGTFEVLFDLEPGQQALRPGQYARISLVVDQREDVVVVPREAVRYEDGRAVVWKVVEAPPPEAGAEDTDARPVGPQWQARRTRVEVGLVDAVRAEVVQGLSAGEEVITIGHASLRDGARVRHPEVERPLSQERRQRAASADDGEGAG